MTGKILPPWADEPIPSAGGYTLRELDAAFDYVRPETHWKDRISTGIPAEARDVVDAAIRHYTGSRPSFEWMGETYDRPGRFWVRAAGYWVAVGS